MKIGVSTACLYPELLENSLQYLGENGVKYTEIFLNTFSEMTPEFIGKLRAIRDAYGIKITALHPFTSGFEPYLLFQNYTRRVEDGFGLYKRFFNIAAALGAEHFVLHGDKLGGALSDSEYFDRFNRLAEAASFEGVVLTQENVNLYRSSDPDFIRKMVDALGNRAIFTFDVKQTIRAGYSPWEVYDAMRGHIAHIHLSDNTEGNECMLPGKGSFPFSKLFRIAEADGFDGSALIEVYSNAYRHPDELIKSLDLVKQKYDEIL